jgi:hypothetical protein
MSARHWASATAVFTFAVVSIVLAAFGQQQRLHSERAGSATLYFDPADDGYMASRFDLGLDAQTATQIAEAIFVSVYGRRVLSERPWKVTRRGKVFLIQGTLHGDLGGTATLEIDATNAAVLRIGHGC